MWTAKGGDASGGVKGALTSVFALTSMGGGSMAAEFLVASSSRALSLLSQGRSERGVTNGEFSPKWRGRENSVGKWAVTSSEGNLIAPNALRESSGHQSLQK